MTGRQPPTWPRSRDPIAEELRIYTVTYKHPVPWWATCHYCGGRAENRDHIVPDSVGGVSTWWNLVPSCMACNQSKEDRQACSCLFCLRAIALWGLGFKREEGTPSRWAKEKARKARRRSEVSGG